MNKRIKQLMDQAGIDVEAVENLGEMPTALKFAELIVQECADIAQQHNKSPVAAPLAIGYVIREHFGVEE
jgi:galactitol-specific phosphotransferase system IIB component